MGKSFDILYKTVREGHTDEVTFEHGPTVNVGKNLVNIRREFQVERIVSTKTLRWRCAWFLWGSVKDASVNWTETKGEELGEDEIRGALWTSTKS